VSAYHSTSRSGRSSKKRNINQSNTSTEANVDAFVSGKRDWSPALQ
jgi:hypothetical protein